MTVFTRIKTALLQILAILPFRNGSFISSLGSKEAITTDCQQGLAKVSDSSNWDKTQARVSATQDFFNFDISIERSQKASILLLFDQSCLSKNLVIRQFTESCRLSEIDRLSNFDRYTESCQI